jgi:uncharacterized protein (TIGR02271 family)
MADQDMTLDRLDGKALMGSDGAKIGTIADVYYDKDTNKPEWALVTTGMFGSKHSFVPITTLTFEGDELRVPFTKDKVKDAPNIDDDGELSQDEEMSLAEHYGIRYSEEPSNTGLPDATGNVPGERMDEQRAAATQIDTRQDTTRQADVGGPGHDTSGPNTDDAMTRSEEELAVSKARRPSGLVRLRKHIVTEERNVTVPVQREEVRIEREPITDANVDRAMGGPDLSEEEHEVTLMEEEVVVDKKVVPKERVRLETDTVTEERQVNETVAKEHIEVEDGGTTRRD